MFGIGGPELVFIFILALLIFGPKKLPQIGRTLGKGMAEFRRASTELQRAINTEIEEPPARPVVPAVAALPPTIAAAVTPPAASEPAAVPVEATVAAAAPTQEPAPVVAAAEQPASVAAVEQPATAVGAELPASTTPSQFQ